MEGKSYLTSKTLWVNVLAIIAMVVQSQTGYVVGLEVQAALLALVNVGLRAITKLPIDWSGKGGGTGAVQALGILLLLGIIGSTAVLHGCATVHPVPEAPGEAIATVANDLDAVGQALYAATEAGLVDKELHKKILEGIKEAREYLEEAKLAYAVGDPAGPGRSAWEWIDVAAALVLKLGQDVPK